jgi:hypothetical protein
VHPTISLETSALFMASCSCSQSDINMFVVHPCQCHLIPGLSTDLPEPSSRLHTLAVTRSRGAQDCSCISEQRCSCATVGEATAFGEGRIHSIALICHSVPRGVPRFRTVRSRSRFYVVTVMQHPGVEPRSLPSVHYGMCGSVATRRTAPVAQRLPYTRHGAVRKSISNGTVTTLTAAAFLFTASTSTPTVDPSLLQPRQIRRPFSAAPAAAHQ